jgi:hypothetical protein
MASPLATWASATPVLGITPAFAPTERAWSLLPAIAAAAAMLAFVRPPLLSKRVYALLRDARTRFEAHEHFTPSYSQIVERLFRQLS